MVYSPIKRTKLIELPWTEEEKVRNLEKLFKDCSLLLPDDKFYGTLQDKNDLDELFRKIKEHLGIKTRKLSVVFSPDLALPGTLSFNDNSAIIHMSTNLITKPLEAAAVLSRLLCSFRLRQSGYFFRDESENQKLTDLATVLAGLGIVIINGSSRIGWRKWFIRKTKSLQTYFPIKSYMQVMRQYLRDNHYDTSLVVNYLSPAVRGMIESSLPLDKKRPRYIKSLETANRQSIVGFVLALASGLLIVVGTGLVLTRELPLLDDELRQQKQKVQDLNRAYKACEDGFYRESANYTGNDEAIQRYLNGKLVKCQSLRNQHNYEVKVYDQMRQRYN